jgi:hypothetical protein
MAMYVLVETDGRWWVAGGQNTPVTDVLPAVSGTAGKAGRVGPADSEQQ